MMTDTQELLANFVKNGSEAAFRELVSRYFDLVYSTAVRLVEGDTHRAEDVAQIVFADLARMAGKLSGSTLLGGWLHRHTCFVARTVMRGERRRQARERQAVEMNALNYQNESVLAQIAPMLDEAIQELGADDRDALLLRFFERRSLRAVGEALGITENVAQKRVARAVEELGILLRRRGLALSATALASALAAGAVTTAPAGLALSIAGAAFSGVPTAGGAGLAPAKVAVMTKLKVGIVGALVVGAVVSTFFLQHQSRGGAASESAAPGQPPEERLAVPEPEPAPQEVAAAASERQVREVPAADVAPPQPRTVEAEPAPLPTEAALAAPQRAVPVSTGSPRVRFVARSGSKVRIEGTSNLHDWQVESSLIGGFLEVESGFPVESGLAMNPGPLQAQLEAFIPVASLRSVGKDGRPYSDAMDDLMHQALRSQQNPRIRYSLAALSFQGVTNCTEGLWYQFESRGDLVVAGVTNEISMPVFALPLGNGKVKLSGRIALKMTSFKIKPPAPAVAQGLIKTGDDVEVRFDWVVAPKGVPSVQSRGTRVPLILDLPAPAYRGIPNGLPLGPTVEPVSNAPRPPMMVPPGLKNLAPGSRLTCSDTNVAADALARITDGDKNASEQSIVFLRKGRQWVQLDLGSPQDIFALVIWHAHSSPKVYHDVIVQVADEPTFTENVRTVFNNDADNSSGLGRGRDREYVETYEGKLLNARGVNGQYIRFYSKGSSESPLNEYTEIEVYGRLAQ